MQPPRHLFLNTPGLSPTALSTVIRDLAPMLLAAAVAGSLYLRTLQPTLGGMYNSEEYQQAAYSLTLAHSTGYPLYLMLGKAWVTLVAVGDVAYRMNLFSAFWAVGAVALTYWITFKLTRSRLAALLAGMVLATNEALWRYASVAEVDTLTAFLAAGVILALLLWREHRLRLEFVGLVYGFALVHHRTSALYAPAIVLYLLLINRSVLRSPALVLRTALAALLPLLAYIYVPLRAATSPDYVQDLSSMVAYVIGSQTTSTQEFVAAQGSWLGRADQIYHLYLWNWFTPAGILLAVVGFIGWSWRRLSALDDSAAALLLLLPTLIVSFFTTFTTAGDIDRYLIVPVLLLAIEIGLGAARLAGWFAGFVPSRRWHDPVRTFLVALLFVFPAAAAATNLPRVDFSQNTRAYRFWIEALTLPVEPGALIIANWSEINAIRYMQRVEGRRPDLRVKATAGSSQVITPLIDQALELGQVVYLTPGDPAPEQGWHYNALGALLRVSREPNHAPPNPPVSTGTQTAALAPLALVGYGLSVGLQPGPAGGQVVVEPLQSARLTLYWQVKGTPLPDAQVQVRLQDAAGHPLWQGRESPLRGLYPMSDWEVGEYVSDIHSVLIPPGTPPGSYRVQVSLIGVSKDEAPVPELIQGLTVKRPATSVADQIFIRQRTRIAFGQLELLGYDPRASLRRGMSLELPLVWHARRDLQADYRLRFEFASLAGQAWADFEAPVDSAFPTSRWIQDDAFKEYYTFTLAADAPLGPGLLRLSVLDPTGQKLPGPTSDASSELFRFSVEP